jgi:hypothetical protein
MQQGNNRLKKHAIFIAQAGIVMEHYKAFFFRVTPFFSSFNQHFSL